MTVASDVERLQREVDALRRALDLRAAAAALPERFLALVCRAGAAWVAVPLPQVLEVLPRLPLEPLPGAAPHVAGYVRLRGAHLPVVEMGLKLAGVALPFHLESRIVVVARVEGEVRGLLVDEVEGVVALERAALSPVRPDTPGAAWALGFAQAGERPLLVLSLDELLRPLAELPAAEGKP